MKKYIRKKSDIPSNIDYIISANLDITENISKLAIMVRDNKKKKRILTYEYPLEINNLEELYKAMRENVKIIVLSLLSADERKHVGIVNIEPSDNYQSVYFEDFYVGNGVIDNLVQPNGTADITISSDRYKMFVSPYKINNKIFNINDYFIFDSKLPKMDLSPKLYRKRR